MNDVLEMKEVVLDPIRGDYKACGAIMRLLLKSHSLPKLVEMARESEFNDHVITVINSSFVGKAHLS